jgi:hypothetical protein
MAASLCCLIAAPSMFGGTVSAFCTPTGTFTGGVGGPTSESCGSFSSDGGGTIGSGVGQDTITAIAIFFDTTYTGGSAGGNSFNLLFGAPSGGTWSAPAVDPCVVTGGITPSGNTCGFYSGTISAPGTTSAADTDTGATLQADAGSAFGVNVQSTLNTGTVTSTSGSIIIVYTYTVNPTTPEPATLGLVGAALIGLGFLARTRALCAKL